MLRGFGVLFLKELREQVRTYRLPIVVAIFLMVGMASPVLAYFTPQLVEQFAGEVDIRLPEPTARDAMDQFIGNLGLVALVSAILLAMGSVAREKESGTAELVLTKPVSRTAFLLAKLLALTITLAAGIAASGVGAYLYTAILFVPLPIVGFVAGCGALLLLYLVYMSFTLMGSALTRSSLAAAAIGFGALVVLLIVSALPRVGDYLPPSLTRAAMSLSLGLPVENLVGLLIASLATVVGVFLITDGTFRRQRL